jgi:hypothetical protein
MAYKNPLFCHWTDYLTPFFVHKRNITDVILTWGPTWEKFIELYTEKWNNRRHSYLRHYATSQKVAGSIPDGVTENFSLTWSSRPHYGPGVDSTSNRNEYRNISWGERRSVRRADNLSTFMWRLSWNLGALNSCNTQGISRSVTGIALPFTCRRRYGMDMSRSQWYEKKFQNFWSDLCWLKN